MPGTDVQVHSLDTFLTSEKDCGSIVELSINQDQELQNLLGRKVVPKM